MQKEMIWLDPNEVQGRESVNLHIAVTGEYGHKLMNSEAIHSAGLEHIDGKDWEMFTAHTRGIHDGQEYLWGMFWEGLGLVDVMVNQENTRELTHDEKKFWSGRGMVMVGSHTGTESYGFRCPKLN